MLGWGGSGWALVGALPLVCSPYVVFWSVCLFFSSVTGEGTTPASSTKQQAGRPVQTKGREDRGTGRQKDRQTRKRQTDSRPREGPQPTPNPIPPTPTQGGLTHPSTQGQPHGQPRRGAGHSDTHGNITESGWCEKTSQTRRPLLFFSQHRGLTTALSTSPGAGPIT